MSKYHINPETGNPNICRAQPERCPFGADDEHFATKAEARKAFEELQGARFEGKIKRPSFDRAHLGEDGYLTDQGEKHVKVYDFHCPTCGRSPTFENLRYLLLADSAECVCGDDYTTEEASVVLTSTNPSYRFLNKTQVLESPWFHATSHSDWPAKRDSFDALTEFHMGTINAAFDRGLTEYADRSATQKGFWLYEVRLDSDVEIADDVTDDLNDDVLGGADRRIDVQRYVNRWEDLASVSLAVKPGKFEVVRKEWITPREARRAYSLYNVRAINPR